MPLTAVSVWPSRAVPEIVGGEIFAGARPVLVSTTSWGRNDAPYSRLATDVLVVVVRAKLTSPFPTTSGVTSTEIQAPERNGPDEPVTVGDAEGALAYVIVVSPQLLSPTRRTS